MVATMTDQVRIAMPHLKEGATYLFEHRRKGPFIGVYRGLKPTKAGDPEDEVFFEVDAYTEDGSGAERLANAFVYEDGRKMRPVYSLKYIRPSLLLTVTSPSTQARTEMTQRYAETIERGKKLAAEVGSDEPILPALSIPTAQAMSRLGSAQAEVKAKSRRLLYAGAAVGVAAVSIIGYLVVGG